MKSISALTLPAVLELKNGGACILLEVSEKGQARLIASDDLDHEVRTDLQSLARDYQGHALLVRPRYRYDHRSQGTRIQSPRAWFWGTLARSWGIYSEVLLASLLINLLTIASPLFIMNVYDRVVPNNAIETLWVLAAGIALVFGFDFLLKTLRAYFIDFAGKRADVLLASQIFDRILGSRMEARPSSAGAFASNLREFETLRDFFTSATLAAIIDLPFIALFIGVIWLIGGPVAYVSMLAVPLVLFVGLLLQIPLGRVVRRVFRESAQKHGTLVEALSGLETVKAQGAEGSLQHRWEESAGRIARSGMTSRLLSSLTINFAGLAQQLAVIGTVVIGVYQIADGSLTVGGLVACTLLTGRALAPLGQIAGILARFHQSMTALKALDKVMKLPQERPLDRAFLHRPLLRGDIELRKVDFQYPGQSVNSLSDVSLKIGAGERVAIIGRIGSGKTTLEKLLLGLYQQTAGTIFLDGTDLRQIDPADLRRTIGYVPQDITLFFGSLRQNIALGNPHADDAAILRAAQLAGVDEFASHHPMGYDLPVGERGEGLSGGQRQAIAIARALLSDPPILIFDEPTNAMDNRSEEGFKNRLMQILPGKTLLVVTHRASLLTLVDRLIVLDGGRVVADGPREAVLQALASERVRAVQT